MGKPKTGVARYPVKEYKTSEGLILGYFRRIGERDEPIVRYALESRGSRQWRDSITPEVDTL